MNNCIYIFLLLPFLLNAQMRRYIPFVQNSNLNQHQQLNLTQRMPLYRDLYRDRYSFNSLSTGAENDLLVTTEERSDNQSRASRNQSRASRKQPPQRTCMSKRNYIS